MVLFDALGGGLLPGGCLLNLPASVSGLSTHYIAQGNGGGGAVFCQGSNRGSYRKRKGSGLGGKTIL